MLTASSERKMSTADHKLLADKILSSNASFTAVIDDFFREHRRRVNALAPVNRLPDDALTSIFACGDMDDRLSVSHVCTRWRTVAIYDPRLWTTLSFHTRHRVELVDYLLQRARGLPARLLLETLSEQLVAAVPSIVSRHLHQLEEFIVRARRSQPARNATISLPAAQHLRALHIEGELGEFGWSTTVLAVRPNTSFPALRRIHMDHVELSLDTWRAFPALVQLTWRPADTETLTQDIYTVLVSCPALESLQLCDLKYDDSEDNRFIPGGPSEAEMRTAALNLRHLLLLCEDDYDILLEDLMPFMQTARHILLHFSVPHYEAVNDLQSWLDDFPADSIYMRDRAVGKESDACLSDATGARRELLNIHSLYRLLSPLRVSTLRILSLPVSSWTRAQTPTFPALESLVLQSVEPHSLGSPAQPPSCPVLRRLTVVLQGSDGWATVIDDAVSALVGGCHWPIETIAVVAVEQDFPREAVRERLEHRARAVIVCEAIPCVPFVVLLCSRG